MRSGNAGPVITSIIVAYALGTPLVAAAVLLVGDTTALGMILLSGPRRMPLRMPLRMLNAAIGGAEGVQPL